MEEDKKLYPLRFAPLTDQYVWGSEVFKICDLGYRDSVVRSGWLGGNTIGEVMDMYMDRVVGDAVFERFGRQFPLQVKYLEIDGKMPLRVHPADETAAQRYDFLGKDKLWYIVSADKDARLWLGFEEDCDATVFWNGVLDGSLPDLLHSEKAVPLQAWHIPSGRIHGATGKLVIAEISESSPLDFCVHAWGQEVSEEEFDPALELVDALDFIDYTPWTGAALEPSGRVLKESPQMRVQKLEMATPLHIYSEAETGFAIYLCVAGEASLREKDGKEIPLKEGEAILVPSECPDIFLTPLKSGTTVLEATVEPQPEPDAYINPDAPEKLPEDL